jgi:AraC-like DNA-binding protein
MIALSAAILGIAATGALSTLRGSEAPAAHRRLLAVYALLAALAAIPLVIAFAGTLYTLYMPATLPMLLALPPAVYLYVEELTAPGLAPPTPRYHAFLPLAGCAVMFGYWTLPAASRETMFVGGELPPGPFPVVLALATFVLIVAWILSSLVYVVAVLRRLNAFRAKLKDRFSNVATRELRWIDWLMGFLAVLWTAVAVTLSSDNFGPGPLFPGEWVLALTAGLLLFVFAAAPIKSAAEEAEAEEAIDSSAEKYARSALSDELAERLAERIDAAMRESRLFLDPNLSLQKLARHVAGAPNHVSQTLNERIGSTFFDYVASWRIEAAKPMILAGEHSILAIAMEVGFNSKSTFYKAFKKETGMTPTAYCEAKGAKPESIGDT